jgi:molybdenum cofactor cytidylyltransferase
VVPVVGGQRGNPIELDHAACAQILASDTNLGCRHLIESQPDLVHVHESTNSRFIADLEYASGRGILFPDPACRKIVST